MFVFLKNWVFLSVCFPGDPAFAEAVWQHSRPSLQGLRHSRKRGGKHWGCCLWDVQSGGRIRPVLWTMHLWRTGSGKTKSCFSVKGQILPSWFFASLILFQAECWLSALESTMRRTVRKEIQEAVAAYEDKPRDQWLFDYPAQVL